MPITFRGGFDKKKLPHRESSEHIQLNKLEFARSFNFCTNGKNIRKIENILLQEQRVEILVI